MYNILAIWLVLNAAYIVWPLIPTTSQVTEWLMQRNVTTS
jgi:hypothetical protein